MDNSIIFRICDNLINDKRLTVYASRIFNRIASVEIKKMFFFKEKPDAKPRRQRKKKPAEWVDKGPKDTKVVLVNPSLFLMLKPEHPTSSNAEHWSPASNHFPVLGKEPEGLPEVALNSPWHPRTARDSFPKLGELDVSKSETKESNTSKLIDFLF